MKARAMILKNTPQREAITKYLEKTKEHPSVEEVYGEIKRKFPHISLATVYRNLKQLEQNKIVSSSLVKGITRYDGNNEKHHHLVCESCGNIEDIEGEIVLPFKPVKDGFVPVSMQLTIRGYCGACARRQKLENSNRKIKKEYLEGKYG